MAKILHFQFQSGSEQGGGRIQTAAFPGIRLKVQDSCFP
ncbi:hypothetical protein AB434_0917 [Heyndrickxia coagulans]|uniref:Uncharacterized protein n=1 Tax=Heyndrickxia coagulans TaxID=1398 RepID=A0AAN0T311_HEYCO|nr:hypothetical protein SB48_HM08orf00371 [Heyndrickxia coagulans]AKN53322.1 hypothetical protein AB434_0917 [Heyndrickxia coagulans]KYC62561.1 hypothetical protein B4100_1612 [Heyndrickxia coagulans]KYC86447.1 hypothetical protein B4096_1556 [Heyndrickxia coagulans]